MASSFSRQRNPNMEKALFDWPIVLQYDVKEISRKFFGHEVCLPARSLSQPKPRCVCIRFIHQSNRSISVRLLFLFCSRVFISRSYENRSIKHEMQCFITRSNTEKRVENTTRSGVFLTNFDVFDLVMKHCVQCLILLLKRNDFRWRN